MQQYPWTSKLCVAAAITAFACGHAWAQRAGDLVVGAGVLGYMPQDKSSPLTFTQPVQREVPGSGSEVHNAVTLGVNLHYFLTDHWAVEGAFGWPPRLKLSGTGTLGPVGELGTARLYGPSVLAKYFFGQPTDKFRVSAGLGLSYARFSHARLTDGLQNTLGATLGLAPGASSTSVKIDSRFGPVFNLGLNYAFTDKLGVSLSLSYVHMRTQATLDTSAGGSVVAQSQARLTLNPIVPYLSITQKF